MPDDAHLRDAKRALRTRVRAIRDALSEEDRLRAAAEILQRILDELTPLPKRIAFFAAIGSEVDVTPIVPALAEMGAETYFPRVEGEAIAFRRATLDELRPGTWGIREPPLAAPEAVSIDVMIVPGVAFDRACRRLGNGKGFYDRALAAARPGRSIGVCFHAQLVDDVPVGPHDVVLDAVATEREIVRRR